MRKTKIVLTLISLFLIGCSNNKNESTTILNDSSTSFIENESVHNSSYENNEYKTIQKAIDYNKTNNTNGLTPSVGNVNILLIPIEFNDIDISLDTNLINEAFNSEESKNLDWYSVSQYYNISSYDNCNLNFIITDAYTPNEPASYYSTNYNNSNYPMAAQTIMYEALEYLNDSIDYNDFDSNLDGYIDGVYLIYNHPVDYTDNNQLWWAFTYYSENENITFDNLKTKSFVFAGYDFLKENNKTSNTHTYIHETAHLFGVDDYYDYNNSLGTNSGGLAKCDMMDGTIGDHNSFTKATLGWNTGLIITTNNQININLKRADIHGDYLILANNFEISKGLLQEYFILEYYTPTNLNEQDLMFSKNGIRMLHINAECKKDGTFRYNNSTTNFKLISQITTSLGKTFISNTTKNNNDTLFFENEELKTVSYSTGERLNYTFKVNKLTNDCANITINKTL